MRGEWNTEDVALGQVRESMLLQDSLRGLGCEEERGM